MKRQLTTIFLAALLLTAVMPLSTAAQGQEPKERILLIGDSMLDGLARRFHDYAVENGHYLRTVIWYGSTSKQWGTTKELQHHIQTERPTLIIMSLGTNEIGYYNMKEREGWVKNIVNTMGNIPFVWIGPVTWPKIKDNGIGSIIRRAVGSERFFDSTKVQMARMKDGVHPTFEASAKWADLIVEWMGRPSAPHPIKMNIPKKKTLLRNYVTFQPRYKGRQ